MRGEGGLRTWSLLSTDPHRAAPQFIPAPQELHLNQQECLGSAGSSSQLDPKHSLPINLFSPQAVTGLFLWEPECELGQWALLMTH